MLLDELVKQGLGETGIVLLVVAETPVANHVNHDVFVERLTEGERQAGHAHARLRIVAVDVEDRRLHHLGDICGIDRRSGGRRVGGESQLIVDDQVNRSTGLVAGERGHIEGFGHHPLAGERRIPVDQQRKDRMATDALFFLQLILRGRAMPSTTGSTASR